MTMYFLRSNISPRTRTRLAVAFVALVVLGVLFWRGTIPFVFTSVTHALGSPLWTLRSAFTERWSISSEAFRSRVRLAEENVRLRSAMVELARDHLYLGLLEEENERLRAIVARGGHEEGMLTAAVLHAQSLSPFDTFVLDVGGVSGVREGMLVRSVDGAALGSVARVLERTSVATAFTAAGVETSAFLLGDGAPNAVTLVGSGAGTMLFSVPRDVLVSREDVVVLPGMQAVPLGTVVAIDAALEDAYQQVYVRPVVNTNHERTVMVDTVYDWRVGDVPVVLETPEE